MLGAGEHCIRLRIDPVNVSVIRRGRFKAYDEKEMMSADVIRFPRPYRADDSSAPDAPRWDAQIPRALQHERPTRPRMAAALIRDFWREPHLRVDNPTTAPEPMHLFLKVRVHHSSRSKR